MATKCCVGGCTSTRENETLYCFPKNEYYRKLWLSFLVPTNPSLIVLSKDQLKNKRVCKRHFDETQFDQEGNRLRYSYPALLSAAEIERGEPLPTKYDDPTFHEHPVCFKSLQEANLSLDKSSRSSAAPIRKDDPTFHEHPVCFKSLQEANLSLDKSSRSSAAPIRKGKPQPHANVDNNASSTSQEVNRDETPAISHPSEPQPDASVDNNASSSSQKINYNEIYSKRNIPTILRPSKPKGKPQPHASVDNNASSTSQKNKYHKIYSRRNIPTILRPRPPKTKKDTEAGLSGQDPAETDEYDPRSPKIEEDIAGLSEHDTAEPIEYYNDDIDATLEGTDAAEQVKETQFSWLKPVEVIDDNEPVEPPPPDPVPSINLEVDSYPVEEQDQEMFPKDKDWSWADKEGEGGDSLRYQCNICGKDISGFRYVCVQCVDFDLCASCEYMRGHDQHYVLRVPQPRPNSEVLFVLRTIRRALVMDAIVDVAGTDHQRPHCVVGEVKEELEDPIAQEFFDIDNDYRFDTVATELNQSNPEEDESGIVRNESTWHTRHRNDSEINTSIEDDYEMVENNTNEAENFDPLEGTSHPNTGSFSLSLQPTDSNLFEIVMDRDQTVDQEIVISATGTKKPRNIHTLILHTDTAKQKTNKRKVPTFLKEPASKTKSRNIEPIFYKSAAQLDMPESTKRHESDLPETFTEEEYLDEYFEVYPENANIVPRADSIQSRLQPTAAVSTAGDRQLPPTRIKMTTKEAHVVLERLRAEEASTALKRKRRHIT
ncbi:zinc finger, ZZ type domain-containing protein [Phthorimaea operculella]|nr:zinc finger, ZZ type domain-containing protein [Phthorimaea operculella]